MADSTVKDMAPDIMDDVQAAAEDYLQAKASSVAQSMNKRIKSVLGTVGLPVPEPGGDPGYDLDMASVSGLNIRHHLRAWFLYPLSPCDRTFWAETKLFSWWVLQIPCYFPLYGVQELWWYAAFGTNYFAFPSCTFFL